LIDIFLIRQKRNLYSKKYGVENINYTHAGTTVIYSSNKVDGKGIKLLTMLMHES